MAEKFIGMTIGVTLVHPKGSVLIGKVTNVILGQTLALQDVLFPATGECVPSWNVAANNIADLQVVDANLAPPTTLPPQPSHPQPSTLRQPFVDPAILSVGKSPAPAQCIAPPPTQHPLDQLTPALYPGKSLSGAAIASPVELAATGPATPVKSALAAAAAAKLPSTAPVSPFIAHAPDAARQVASAKPLKKQPKDFFADPVAEAAEHAAGKRSRKGRRTAIKNTPPVVAAATEAQTVKDLLSPNVSRSGKDMNAITPNHNGNKKGWRSTPLLKEVGNPDTTKSKKKSKRSERATGVQNGVSGWATEDATDIQDLGDFDFEANLNKFDKRTVFDQIRIEDTTADEDRLVSHNRLARPGTNGGKNLHPTENVLSPSLKPYESPELGSTSDADTELNYGSGQNSRRAMSRTSSKRPPRRSNSNMPDEGQTPVTATFQPGVLQSGVYNRSMGSLRNSNSNVASSVISTSPNPNRTRSPTSGRSAAQSRFQHSIIQGQGPHFYVRSNNQACTSLSPERLRQAEAEAVANIKISADALTESAARGIADSALESAVRSAPSRRSSKTSKQHVMNGSNNSEPVVTILAGNHLGGARAVASARHIYGRGYRVLVSVLDFHNPHLWHPQLATQIQSLQALGRKAARIEGWRSTSGHLKRLDGPPAVIIDGLLNGQKHSEIQSAEQQAETRDMIDWANRSRAGVLSINIPSGFSAVDGSTSVVEGEPLAVRPEMVLALAAPTVGLLEAVKEGEGAQWHISAVDVGINVALGEGEKVKFGTSWTAALEFDRGETT